MLHFIIFLINNRLSHPCNILSSPMLTLLQCHIGRNLLPPHLGTNFRVALYELPLLLYILLLSFLSLPIFASHELLQLAATCLLSLQLLLVFSILYMTLLTALSLKEAWIRSYSCCIFLMPYRSGC